MPRQGRLCEAFDRITDAITGITDTSLGSYEGGGTQVWEDGRQEAQWQWYARSSGGAPNSPLGCDINGCYVNTVSSAENVNIQVGEEDKTVIIAYPAKLYFKFNSTNSQTGGSNRHVLGVRLSNSEEGGDDTTPTVTFSVSCGTRSGGTIDGMQVTEPNFGASGYTFFSITGGTSYWFSIDFSPGQSMSVRMWAAGSSEPDDALIAIESDDGYFIPDRIDGIELFVNPVASAGKTYFQRMFIDGHCFEDWVSEPAPSAPAVVQVATSLDPTAVAFSTPATAGNVIVAYTARRGAPGTGFNPGGSWQSIGPGSGASLLDNFSGANPDAGTIQAWWRPAVGGETNVGALGLTAGDTFSAAMELQGVSTSGPYNIQTLDTQSPASHQFITGVLAPAGSPAIIIGIVAGAGVGGANGWGLSYSPDSGYVEQTDALAGPSLGPRSSMVTQVVSSAASSYSPGATENTAPAWCAIGLSFEGGVSEGI